MSSEEPSPKLTLRLLSVRAESSYLASTSEPRMMSVGTVNLGCCGSFSITRNLRSHRECFGVREHHLTTPSNTEMSRTRGLIPASLATRLALILEPVKSRLAASTLYANSGSAALSSRLRVQKGFCGRGSVKTEGEGHLCTGLELSAVDSLGARREEQQQESCCYT